jgi:hypothetical protein
MTSLERPAAAGGGSTQSLVEVEPGGAGVRWAPASRGREGRPEAPASRGRDGAGGGRGVGGAGVGGARVWAGPECGRGGAGCRWAPGWKAGRGPATCSTDQVGDTLGGGVLGRRVAGLVSAACRSGVGEPWDLHLRRGCARRTRAGGRASVGRPPRFRRVTLVERPAAAGGGRTREAWLGRSWRGAGWARVGDVQHRPSRRHAGWRGLGAACRGVSQCCTSVWRPVNPGISAFVLGGPGPACGRAARRARAGVCRRGPGCGL